MPGLLYILSIPLQRAWIIRFLERESARLGRDESGMGRRAGSAPGRPPRRISLQTPLSLHAACIWPGKLNLDA